MFRKLKEFLIDWVKPPEKPAPKVAIHSQTLNKLAGR